ncbi:MAG: YafY family protein [Lachnospiraceae bacterium]|nr:YafY family protein [Lachnospiraceae bacterium]
MKIERLIGIVTVLLQKEKVTAPFLAEKFEVSRRTINRDIEVLCQAGIPIVTTQGVGGGISIMEGYKMDRTLLTSTEMQAILAGLRSLDSVSGTNRYRQLMDKISPEPSNLMTADQHILIDLATWNKGALAPKIELIHDAIERQEWIEFYYYAPKGEAKRRIEPYHLIFQWSSWYVWGFCELRQDFRLFKLNRMEHLKGCKEQFEKRKVPIPDLSQEKVFPSTYQVKAVITAENRWRLIEEYGPDSFTVQEDGNLLFESGFTDKETVLRWVLSFGNQITLLEPGEIREELFLLGKQLEERYRE